MAPHFDARRVASAPSPAPRRRRTMFARATARSVARTPLVVALAASFLAAMFLVLALATLVTTKTNDDAVVVGDDVAVEAFARDALSGRLDPGSCARHASLGAWSEGDEGDACAPSAWTLASDGCGSARFPSFRASKSRQNAVAWKMESTVAKTCGFSKVDARERREKVIKLARGRRVAFVGDSSARFAYGGFIAATSEVWSDVGLNSDEKHRDWSHVLVGGARGTFTWAPYAEDAYEALAPYEAADASPPDLIVISSSLWHVLNDRGGIGTYVEGMKKLSARVRAINDRHPGVIFVWLNAPSVVRDKLVAADKIRRFTDENMRAYDAVQRDQTNIRMIHPAGPGILVDLTTITAKAPTERCVDGVHYDRVVYDAVAQITLNIARSHWR